MSQHDIVDNFTVEIIHMLYEQKYWRILHLALCSENVVSGDFKLAVLITV